MSRAGIGSGGAGSSGGGAFAGLGSSAGPSRSAAELSALFDAEEDPVSMSLDAEFEGGQWINGEFYYSKQRERRPMSKEEQLYGYDAQADAEFYAAQRQSSARKKMGGGINFVLGATLQPEANAKQKAEQEAAAVAAATAAAQRGTKRARNDNDDPAQADDAAAAGASGSAAEAEEISFRQLRQQKNAGAGAASGRRSRQEELDEAEEEERRMAGRGAGLGFSGRAPAGSPPPAAAAAAAASSSSSRGGIGSAKPAPAKVDKDFAQFTRYTTGFGLKMLAAHGYRPGDRLGKHGTGVINPILPKLRPKDMGLGFGDFKENDKASYARNAQEEAELQAKEEEKAAKKKAEKAAAAAAAPVRPGWKKDGAAAGRGRKPKREYKTAAELVAADTQQVGGASAATPLVVMDYRGATARVTSLDKVTAAVEEEPTGADGPAPQLLPELQHNLRLLVSMSEEEIRKLDRARRDSQKRVQQLRDQKDHIESGVEHEERQVTAMRRLVARIDESVAALKAVPRAAPNSLVKRIHIVVDMLRALQTQFRQEFVLYDIAQRSLPLVYPLIRGLLYNWQPLETPSAGAADLPVLDLLALFKPLLSGASIASSPTAGGSSFQSALHARSSDSSHSLYHQLLEELLLPKLRLELSNPQTCSIRLHSSAILGMVGRVERVCPASLHLHIVSHLVYPSLAHEVATWNPRLDPVPVHDWVLPYTRVLPEALLHKLYDAIRLKLSITLQEWSAADHSAIHVIAPWFGRFKPDAFDALMQRSVLPKLQTMVHTQLHINPKQQDMAPFLAVVPWINLVVSEPAAAAANGTNGAKTQQQQQQGQRNSVTLLRNLLVQEFFPKWFRALYGWLGGASVGSATLPPSAPDFEEVSAWYLGWKAQFPSALLDLDPQRLLQQCFSKALDLMNAAASDAPIQPLYEQTMRWLQSPATLLPPHAPQQQQQQAQAPSALGRSALAAHLPTGPSPSSSAAYLAASAEGDDTAFLSVILQLASLHSLEFEPALRKGTVQGKQIYLFGPCQVYVLRGVVYAKEGAAWAPVALDQLIEKAKQQKQEAAPSAAPTANARTRRPAAAPQSAPAAAPAHDDVD